VPPQGFFPPGFFPGSRGRINPGADSPAQEEIDSVRRPLPRRGCHLGHPPRGRRGQRAVISDSVQHAPGRSKKATLAHLTSGKCSTTQISTLRPSGWLLGQTRTGDRAEGSGVDRPSD
jgi:hypothetical protein